MKVQNLVQFAQERGLVTHYEVSSHVHAGLRSKPTTKTYQRWFDRRFAELRAAADETERLYAEAIERGEIAAPEEETHTERLLRASQGEGPRAEAARRVLAKRAAKKAKRRA